MISFVLVPEASQTSMNFSMSELVYWKVSITCDEKCTRPTSTNPNLTRKWKRRNNEPNKIRKLSKRKTNTLCAYYIYHLEKPKSIAKQANETILQARPGVLGIQVSRVFIIQVYGISVLQYGHLVWSCFLKSDGKEKSTKIFISWQELKSQFPSFFVHR